MTPSSDGLVISNMVAGELTSLHARAFLDLADNEGASSLCMRPHINPELEAQPCPTWNRAPHTALSFTVAAASERVELNNSPKLGAEGVEVSVIMGGRGTPRLPSSWMAAI